MAGDEQGHELVAELLVGHRRAVLVARLEQHREHVVAPSWASRRSSTSSKTSRSTLLAQVDEAGHRAEPVEEALHPRRRADEQGHRASRRTASIAPSAGAQGVEALAGVESEDGAQDHLERQPLHPRVQLDRGLGAPGGNLALGHRGDQPLEPLSSARRGTPAASACAAPCAASPSSRITELRPTIGSSVRAPSPGWRTSAGAVKIPLISSGVGQHHERRRGTADAG